MYVDRKRVSERASLLIDRSGQSARLQMSLYEVDLDRHNQIKGCDQRYDESRTR